MSAGPGETMIDILIHLVHDTYDGEDTLYNVAVLRVVNDYVKRSDPLGWITDENGEGDYWRDPTPSEWSSIRRAVRRLVELGYVTQWSQDTVIGYRDQTRAAIHAVERWVRVTPAGKAYLESTYDDDD